MRQSGLLLMLLGLLGVAFFMVTDARLAPQWATHVGWSSNLVDAAADSLLGTVIGVIGSIAIMVVGGWLALRRSI